VCAVSQFASAAREPYQESRSEATGAAQLQINLGGDPLGGENQVKSIKTLSLVMPAVLMAMAFAGASAAMAESTTLCTADGSGCGVTHIHETTLSGAKAKILAGLITVSCDVLFLGDALSGLANPLLIHGNFTYTNCGSCTATELVGSYLELLKEGSELARALYGWTIFVDCGGAALECEYSGVGLVGTARGPLSSKGETNGEIKITNQVLHKIPGGPLCSNEAKLDITTTPLSATYISS